MIVCPNTPICVLPPLVEPEPQGSGVGPVVLESGIEPETPPTAIPNHGLIL